MCKILFFDLETTGLDPEKSAIHQFTAISVMNGVVTGSINERIKPFEGAEVSQDALDVAGLQVDDLMSYQDQNTAYKKIEAFLDKKVQKFNKKDKFHLAGFNIMRFDNNFLRAFFARNGNKYFGSYFWSDSIDVMALASNELKMIRSEMTDFKQGTVAETMGIKVDHSRLHDSLYDVEICMEIYKRCTPVSNIY